MRRSVLGLLEFANNTLHDSGDGDSRDGDDGAHAVNGVCAFDFLYGRRHLRGGSDGSVECR